MLPTTSEPPAIRPAFDLIDHHGRAVDLTAFRGSFVLVFFGFTHCRVVCPRALKKLSSALEALDEDPTQLIALYITVDPERDTPQVMRAFLETYPRILGLTGSRDQIEIAKRNFRVFSRRSASPTEDGNYDVPHTAMTYLLDPEGRYIAHFNDSLDLPEFIERLRIGLTEGGR
ncbi:SCO family protein [Rhodopseudomonas sp. B29]|uniref:SCO family protein n=1 Tax=Rhodopseudomonas sp. B29 TaxID=95607 RepID=UPI0003B413DB|nr:SCO family protein [Rhodopseudomonas sp. B29]